jgi:hypothetical protein
VNFSGTQWATIVGADLLLRGIALFPYLPISIPLSLGYVCILVLTNHTVADLGLSRPVTTILICSNVLYLAIFLGFWLWMIKSGHQTFCISDRCAWTKGQVSAYGVQLIALNALSQIFVNTLPALGIWQTYGHRNSQD